MKDAEKLIKKIQAGEVEYDLVEIMACPGGCVAGGGQPVSYDEQILAKRKASLKKRRKSDPHSRSRRESLYPEDL